MVVSGSQQALEITARVLLDPGDSVWIEEPSYQLTRSVLLGAGCRLNPIPVDGEGIDVAAGIRRGPNARAAFVTPSHQYPLGSTMSASRRLQLLNWAEAASAWIIEDDYDSEYRYEVMPISSLQGLDSSARVIYIGTFSKVLFASLRIGYIVIPADLVERYTSVRMAMDIFPPYLYQEVLADFMQRGHFTRHIRKMRALYKKRRTALINCIHAEFGNSIELHGVEAGMHVAATLPSGFSDIEIATKAAQRQLWLWPLSRCYSNEVSRQGFILGYGSTSEEQICRAISQLRTLLVPRSV
jgi:GntR family transcriptional regulator/MocR family aminotransferase